MSDFVTIAELLVVPEWGRLRPVTHTAEIQSPLNIAIGLRLSSGRLHWGHCSLKGGFLLPGWPRTLRVNEALAGLREIVAPAVEGLAVTTFREMAPLIDRLQEQFEVEKELPQAPAPEVKAVSRRSFLTAGLSDPEPASKARFETFTLKRVLHPAIRFGVSQALVRAVAGETGRTPGQQLAFEWGWEGGKCIVPVELLLSDDAALPITGRITGFNFAVPLPTTKEILGPGASIFENWTRHVNQQLKPHRSDTYNPVSVIDARGVLSDYFDNSSGKLLGCLYGLDLAAGPAELWVIDPVFKESGQEQVKAMQALARLCRRRKLQLKLAVGASIRHPGLLRELIESEAVHAVHIDLPTYGSLHQSMAAVTICREAGLPYTIGDSQLQEQASIELLADVAIACEPERVVTQESEVAGLRRLYGAMSRQVKGMV